MGSFTPAFTAIILALLFIIFTASTLDVMSWLLGITITLPTIWLMQTRQPAMANLSSSLQSPLDVPNRDAREYVDGAPLAQR